MYKYLLSLALGIFLVSQPAFSRPGTETANQTAKPAQPADSVVPELSEIVVLCAQDEKNKFEKEWSKYVSKHDLKGVKLKETIAWVSEEAAMKRKKNRQKHDPEEDEAWIEERRQFMQDVARKALSPAR